MINFFYGVGSGIILSSIYWEDYPLILLGIMLLCCGMALHIGLKLDEQSEGEIK